MSSYKPKIQLSDVDNEILNQLSALVKDLKKNSINYEPLHTFLTRRADQVIQVWSKLRDVSISKIPFSFYIGLTNIILISQMNTKLLQQ